MDHLVELAASLILSNWHAGSHSPVLSSPLPLYACEVVPEIDPEMVRSPVVESKDHWACIAW